jgi:hypothetical protein
MTALINKPPESKVLHAIALFEGVKGIAAISASIGLLSLTHHDIRALARSHQGSLPFKVGVAIE